MSAPALPFIDAGLPALLRRLQAAAAQGPLDASALDDRDGRQLADPMALLGALCLGGTALALQVAALASPAASDDEHLGAVIAAFAQAVDPPPGAAPDHERRVAQALVEAFGLAAEPAALLDLLRAGILIDHGPLAEVPEAVLGAMRHTDWALALRGLERVRAGLQGDTPRQTYGLGALCLHRLGRFDEADAWAAAGLGEQQQLLQPPPLRTEAELLRRWGRHERPVVTILCTTYNHERYIESAIRGFLGQDCSHPFEILIHDDASTDGTQAVIRRWAERYPTIIKPLLQTENQKSRGVHPFELLLARARGDFVATCEGDDYWIRADKLQRQVDFLIAHPDVSCSAHNYYHYLERSLTVRPWSKIGRDFYVSQRQLMATQMLIWMPTLVFRRSFSALPPERALAAFGDQFLTSYLGTLGRCAYLETLMGAVRRENEFSSWSPLPEAEKERRRVKTWTAMLRMHERLGHAQAVSDLRAKIDASRLDPTIKAALLAASAPSSATGAAADATPHLQAA